MFSPAVLNITPAMTFRPMSPFLEMLIDHAQARLSKPEGLAPASVTQPVRIEPQAPDMAVRADTSASKAGRLDRSV
jgi:hypothetical protein